MNLSIEVNASSKERIAAPELPDLIFSPKIDYVTLDGVCKPMQDCLSGTVVWPRTFLGKRLTVHDPSADDLVALHRRYPNARISEAEIAIDVRPRRPKDEAENLHYLRMIKAEVFAKRLTPHFPPGMNGGFRGSYRHCSKRPTLNPFNRRVPALEEQLLYGHRRDHAQVKVYAKTKDNRRTLNWTQYSIRVEVRLAGLALIHHEIHRAGDFIGFPFRRALSSYFRLVSGTTRPCFKRRSPVSPTLLLLNNFQHLEDQKHWNAIGVGPFLRGGKREQSGARMLRDQELNDRIGQALHRLQQHFSDTKFVCMREAANDANVVSMGLSRWEGK